MFKQLWVFKYQKIILFIETKGKRNFCKVDYHFYNDAICKRIACKSCTWSVEELEYRKVCCLSFGAHQRSWLISITLKQKLPSSKHRLLIRVTHKRFKLEQRTGSQMKYGKQFYWFCKYWQASVPKIRTNSPRVVSKIFHLKTVKNFFFL